MCIDVLKSYYLIPTIQNVEEWWMDMAKCGFCVWLLCVALVCGSCVWLLCVALVCGSCVWLLCVALVCGSCVWLLCV
jgi:hypothetical protein